MGIEENKAIGLRFGTIWGKGDISIVDELGSPKIATSARNVLHEPDCGWTTDPLVAKFRRNRQERL